MPAFIPWEGAILEITAQHGTRVLQRGSASAAGSRYARCQARELELGQLRNSSSAIRACFSRYCFHIKPRTSYLSNCGFLSVAVFTKPHRLADIMSFCSGIMRR